MSIVSKRSWISRKTIEFGIEFGATEIFIFCCCSLCVSCVCVILNKMTCLLSTSAVFVIFAIFLLRHSTVKENIEMSGAVIPIVTRLSNNIIRILGCNPGPMTLQGTNTYLLGTGKKRILLDAGDIDKPLYIENLKNVLHSEKASIETILLTHWHHDHIGGVRDVLSLLDPTAKCKVWKYPRTDASDDYEEIPKFVELHKLSNDQEFSVDGASVKVLHTPGHTTDHVVLMLKEDNSLFSGDCILGEGTAVFEDLYDYMKSLSLILDKNPSRIYPAHGNIIDDPIPKIQFYINHRNQRESQILDVLKTHPDQSFTEMNLVKIIYKETPEALWPAAAYNVNHHLSKLTKERLVNAFTKDGDSVWQFRPISSVL